MVFGKHINRYYLRYLHLLLLGLFALVMVDMLQLEIPELYQMVINGIDRGQVTVDGVTVPFDMAFLLDRICLPMVKIILAMVFGRFLWRACFFGVAIKVETDLRERMFDNSRRLSQNFYQHSKVGDLMSLYTNDLDTVQECFGWGIMMFFDALLLGILAVVKMWNMDKFLTVMSMIPMLILMVCATFVGQSMTKKWDIRQEAYSKLSDFTQESFSGISVIKAFVKELLELAAFKRLNVENEQANISHTKTAVFLRIMVMLFVESVICVILGYGGYLVHQDVFNAGQLVEFIGYFTAVIWPIMAVSELIDMSSRGKASLLRISRLLEEQPDVTDRPQAQPLSQVRGKIEFRHLTFLYPDMEHPALEDLCFTVEAGQSVGIVGKTGSGKTTLVDLLLRTYNVPDGMLFIDDKDVNDVAIGDLRAACAYVPQDNFLFSETIENNISFGVPSGQTDAVIQAARLADVDSNIQAFQQGYGTVLGERGVTVSGGQKQRISIARALMKDAPILILDDSVSAVDTKTEQAILTNLRATRKGKTTILIAHRISTIENMDKILFLEEGRLTDTGTHTQLYQRCEAYRKMVNLQRLEEEGAQHE